MIVHARGRIAAAGAGAYEAELPAAVVGAAAQICGAEARSSGVITQVRGTRARIAPLDAADGIRVGDAVTTDGGVPMVALGMAALGRAVNACGFPIDGGLPLEGRCLPLEADAPAPLTRARAIRPCWTGVRAIDGFATLARGQRVGIFGGAGVGKSSLLHAIARNAQADAVVIALIGERGREVHGWIDAIGAARARTTLVCATANEPPALRARAPLAAMAQAEYLRARGLHVLLVVDSLARYCVALRELAAANGETTALRGYPPSAFAALGRLLERAGAGSSGAITAICSVLVEGDDDREPIADAARAILDGHLVLSRRIAEAGRFPALDVLASCSRLFSEAAEPAQVTNAATVRRALAILDATRDLRGIGAYVGGSDPVLDAAIAAEPAIDAFLCQTNEASPPDETLHGLAQLAARLCRIGEREP